jgi:hypothetical protein
LDAAAFFVPVVLGRAGVVFTSGDRGLGEYFLGDGVLERVVGDVWRISRANADGALDAAALPAGINGGDLVALNRELLLLSSERRVLLGEAPGEVLAR